MRNGTKLLMAAITAVLLLALVAGPAAASRSFSIVGGGRAIRATSLRGLTFAGSTGTNVISDVTLHGSVHRLIGKAIGSLAGVINQILVANCRTNVGVGCRAAGVGFFHLLLLSFTGTLPRITGVLIGVHSAFRIDIDPTPEGRGRPSCFYRGIVEARAEGRPGAAEFTIERLEPLRGNRVPLIEARLEEFFRRCPASGELQGGFTLTPLVTIRLH